MKCIYIQWHHLLYLFFSLLDSSCSCAAIWAYLIFCRKMLYRKNQIFIFYYFYLYLPHKLVQLGDSCCLCKYQFVLFGKQLMDLILMLYCKYLLRMGHYAIFLIALKMQYTGQLIWSQQQAVHELTILLVHLFAILCKLQEVVHYEFMTQGDCREKLKWLVQAH
jgi:hypothetical protein